MTPELRSNLTALHREAGWYSGHCPRCGRRYLEQPNVVLERMGARAQVPCWRCDEGLSALNHIRRVAVQSYGRCWHYAAT